jgi:hypothetical protein
MRVVRHPPNIFARKLDLADLVDIEDIEVVQTGIEYNLASGPKTFTVEDLADAVAAQDDPAVKTPRVKLGHTASLGLMEDGQPAIGTVHDMRLEQGGHTVMGTLKEVPEWLATVLPSAYPARSIEGATDVSTNTGNNWQLVITDLALLGVVWPGVTTLEDVQALYSKNGPDNLTVLTTKEEVAALSVAAAAAVTAQVNVEDVQRSWSQFKASSDEVGYWWWIRAMLQEPNELIVEDEDTGDLYRVPYAIKGETVEFDSPIAVKIEYKDKPKPKEDKQAASLAAAAALAGLSAARPNQKTIAQYPTREEEMRVTASAVQSGIDPIALRTALGLDDDASDEDVQVALASAGFVTPPGTSAPGGAPASESTGTTATGGQGQPDNTAPAGPSDPATARPDTQPTPPAGEAPAGTVTPPTTASGGSGVRTLDEDTYQRLLRGAERGDQAFTRQQTDDRNQIIDAAIKAGKIAPSRRDFWLKKFEADEEEARTFLTAAADKGGLAPGLIPVQERGHTASDEDLTVEAYPKEWLPDVHSKNNRQGGITS